MSTPTDAGANTIESQTIRMVSWRLLPYLMLLFLVAFIDRANVGIAALRMNEDLGLSPAVFGLGAGLFFLTYTLFEVPSNMIMHRVGARLWIARILITWGIVASLMAAVVGPTSFNIVRLALGASEAGLYPGVLLYISLWFPRRHQGFALAVFSCAGPIALSIGNVISTLIMESFDGVLGLHGWQWMYIVEGVPAVLLGFVTLKVLPNGPRSAGWLPESNRQWLLNELERDQATTARQDRVRNPFPIIFDKDVLFYTAIMFCLVQGNIGLSTWLPQIIQGITSGDPLHSGLLSALPYACAVPVMILAARHSDRTQERRVHVMAGALAGAAGLVLSTLTDNVSISLVALCLAASGTLSALAIIFSMPMAFLSGGVAAVALAFINAFGNSGGFVGPYLVGLISEATTSFGPALWMLAALLALGGLIALRQPSGRLAQAAASLRQ